MNDLKLFISIGAGIFGGMLLMTFIQLHGMESRLEAIGFIGISAVIYFLLLWINHKGHQKAFTSLVFILAVLAVSAVMLHGTLFSAPH